MKGSSYIFQTLKNVKKAFGVSICSKIKRERTFNFGWKILSQEETHSQLETEGGGSSSQRTLIQSFMSLVSTTRGRLPKEYLVSDTDHKLSFLNKLLLFVLKSLLLLEEG